MTFMRMIAAGFFYLAVACAPTAGVAETHIIEIEGMAFAPSSIDAAIGDTITWVNHDVVPHTATADDGSWDSGTIEKGASWSLTVEAAGAIGYACRFHPQMTGAINVR